MFAVGGAARLLGRAALVGAVVVLALLVTGSATATAPGANGTIYFSARVDGASNDNEILSINADGTGLQNVTPPVVHVTGQSDGDNYDPALTGDGSRFVWQTNRCWDTQPTPYCGTHQIGIANADGSGQQRLTDLATSDQKAPTISPDGTEIAFASDRVTGCCEIWTEDLATSALTQVTHTGQTNTSDPAFSPDGTKLAYDSNGHVWVIPVTGGTPLDLGPGLQPTWSPDGAQIAYVSGELFRRNADGSGTATQLTNAGCPESSPSWSPDGQWIVFHDSCDGGLDIVSAIDGSSRHTLISNDSSAYPNVGEPELPDWQTVPSSPATFLVTNTSDFGQGSLRQAILDADSAGGGTIRFDIAGGGPQTIGVVTGPLPEITRGVTLDGTTQPGYESGGPPLISLDGTECDGCSYGLDVSGGSGTTIEGLSITHFSGYGVEVSGSADATLVEDNVVSQNQAGGFLISGGTNTQLAANHIGTDDTGTLALGNGSGAGIAVTNGSGITVGGSGGGQGNVISGNTEGIELSGFSSGFTAEHNLIGVNASGIAALGNGGAGINIDGSDNVGNAIDGNVISGNAGSGISLINDGVGTTSITGNNIGTDATGSVAVANKGDGILLNGVFGPGIAIGGTGAAARNVIAGNAGFGIELDQSEGVAIEGNYVGVDAAGAAAIPNGADGVGLEGSANNTIGGTGPGAGNLVSGNTFAGISLVDSSILGNADANTIQGNSVGVDASGTAAIPNGGNGISISGADNTVGGAAAGAGNVVSGSGLDGVSIHGTGATGNIVAGNLIGTDASGTGTIGNFQRGVFVSASAANNTIGGRSPGDANVISGNGNGEAGGGIAIGSLAGSGNIVDGNYIGTNSTGTAHLGNSLFGIAIDGSGETVGQIDGGGNTIAFNGGPGVLVSSGSGNTIRFDSIHDNGGLGIELDGTANNALGAPHIAAATVHSGFTDLSGALSAPDGSYTVDFYDNASCDPSGAGEGATHIGSTSVTVSGGSGTFDTGDTIGPVSLGDAVTATATDATGNTSAFSQCATASLPASGSLTGTVAETEVKPVDLTGTGTADWALWGYDSSPGNVTPPTSLTPNETKANGGRQISDLSVVGGSGAPRGFGGFTSVPFNFSWTDGAPDANVSGGYAGLTAPAVGQGLQFTVPADTTPRTLTIWTSAHYADGKLTAHLSDGSAADFVDTVHAVQGQFTDVTENVPAVFTIHFQAASAGQHLTVSWDQTANNNCPNCDDVVIYAAALSGGGNATGASASFSSDPSVQMSGTVPIADIPLAAFDPQPSGAPPITTPQGLQLGNTQLGNTQLGNTQLGNTQLGNTQLGNTQLGNTQLGNTQLGNTQLGNTQLGNTQLGNTQLGQTQLGNTQLGNTVLDEAGLTLDQVPLDSVKFPNGWPGLLSGTSLADEPLQTITLHDVFALTTPAAAVAAIHALTFADVDIAASTLGRLTMNSIALGGSLINQLGGDLQSTIESQLQSWCLSIVPAGDPGNFCTGADPGIGYFSLIQLTLIGAPVGSLQLGNTQLGNTQLGNTQLGNTQLGNTPTDDLSGSASGIVGMQLSKLDLTPGTGIADLLVSSLPASTQSSLFDCTNPLAFDCATGTLGLAWLAGAIKPTTLVGDLDVGSFFKGVTLQQLLDSVRGPLSAYKNLVTFGDVVGLLLRSTDVSWESLSPDILTIFDPSRHELSMTAGFTVDGTGSPPADVKIDLPAGFDYLPGSATLAEGDSGSTALADPTITSTSAGLELLWHLNAVDANISYSLSFEALPGTTVGPTQATETVTAGGHSSSSIAGFSVTDSNQGNDTAGNATPIDTAPAHDTVEMSTLPKPGAVDYYTIPMPPAGTRISVHLTDLPADYDLALYSPRTTSVRTGATAAPPLQDGVVPDQQVNFGGSNAQLTPSALEDVPNPGIPLVQLSDNRHQDPEDVGMVSPGGPGSITVAVFGYNGAFSPKAYTLRVRETPPQASESCTKRTLPGTAGTTIDSLPSLTALPSNLNTIILVNEKRLGDTYGPTDETNAVAKLNHLAGDASLGVSGVVVPVEAISGVPALYAAWDSNPCNPDAANAVANAIANEVDAIVAVRPSVKYVVFGGGDDQIPFFRLPDLSLIANERGFAGQFSNNEYFGSLAAGDLLSDDPYLDTNPVPASGQQLFPPNLAGGRLVETAQDIANAVTAFETAPTPGALKSSTGFVSGYDFIADGSQRVADNLTHLGVSVTTLIDNPLSPLPIPWGSAALLAAAFPAGGPANINSWNGHYDNYRAQMDNGDILSTSQLPPGLNNGIFFTMGCHAGFQTTDVVVGSSVLDWPQYFSEHNTGFVGNTGFGLGETDSVAFSEELMSDLAGQLGGSVTLGQALLGAKQQYYLSRVAFSNYDEKALSEAELYGLPMYGVGRSPTSLAGPSNTSPDPVSGTSHSTSPSTGSLSPFTTGVQSANFAATPSFSALQHGTNGDFFTNAGQVQAPNYRPLQPYVTLPAGRPGAVAHGVVIDSLSSQDVTPFTPDNVRPILNSSAAEPPPTFTDEAWPDKIPTLVSLGANQDLNLATGQFFTDAGAGVERLWTDIGGRVTYSSSPDFTPPTINSINAYLSNGVLAFTGSFSDLDQNGNPGTVAFAQVVYDGGTGTWHALPLQYDSTSQTWSGGVPFGGAAVQYFVEVCDAAGNCGYSSNKGRYFDAAPLPTATGGTLTITPSRPPDTAGTWYHGSLDVTANGAEPEISVDGGAFIPVSSGPFTLTGDGAHVVRARDAAGDTATAVYLIDTTGPLVTHTISPATPNGNNGWYKAATPINPTGPTVTFSCTDNLSGVATCSAPVTLGEGASQGATGTGTDNAGNTSANPDVVSGIKVDLTPPTLPVFTGIQAGTIYPINNVPAPGAIKCTATDTLSGYAGCTFTGYSAAVGTHVLTATATDNAGNTSTSTLTYTVGFQAGNILSPVTASSGDQTNPNATDLQVFKIKSTVPLKFQFYLDAARTTLMTTPPAGSTAIVNVFTAGASTSSTDVTTYVTAPADAGNQFRWTGSPDYQYVYNMATSKLTAGEYYCTITLYDSTGSIIGQSAPQYFKLKT